MLKNNVIKEPKKSKPNSIGGGIQMVELQLLKEHFQNLYFDGLNGGKSKFKRNNDSEPYQLNSIISEDEFNQFLKENNIILYKNVLKQYEDGEIIGYFLPQE